MPAGTGLKPRRCRRFAALRDGGFLLLGKFGDGKVIVQSPHSPRPVLMTKAEFLPDLRKPQHRCTDATGTRSHF
jgi:hypothetical protein